MDGEVQSHEFCELRVLVTKHVGEVGTPIQLGVDSAHGRALSVQVTVNNGSHGGQLGNKIHGVFEAELPVFGLGDTLTVGLGKETLRVEGSDGGRELSHGVESGRETVEHCKDVWGKVSTVGPFFTEGFHLQRMT